MWGNGQGSGGDPSASIFSPPDLECVEPGDHTIVAEGDEHLPKLAR